MNPEWIEIFVRLAYEFGPFLFAILFLLSVTRTAHQWFYKISSRSTPPATAREQITYQTYFIACCVVGIGFSISSVMWWFIAHESEHVYVFAIQNVSDDDIFSVDNAFYRKSFKEMSGKVLIDQYDDIFVITRDSPFVPGEEILVKYWNARGIPGGVTKAPAPTLLRVRYHGQKQDYYSLQYDSGKPVLRN